MDWDKKYIRICKELSIDPKKDREATAVLESLLQEQDTRVLKKLIKDKIVIVFGCGPSLKKDIAKIKATSRKFTFIAADGAVEALLEDDIVPYINVTDLDSNLKSIIEANELGTVTLVHAHGDNILKLRNMVPRLKGVVIGTTQTTPTNKVKNFGGFTDGDRAVFLAVHFKANKILLAGMNFGTKIGNYSGSYAREKKLKKLQIGKKLIEELASKTKIPILNVTSGGEDLEKIPRIPTNAL